MKELCYECGEYVRDSKLVVVDGAAVTVCGACEGKVVDES